VKFRYEVEATAASNTVVILGTENGYRMLALDQVSGQLRVYGNSPDNNRSTEPSNMTDGRFNEEYPLITSDLKWCIRPLTKEEMNKVIAELSENGIPYELINAPSNEKNLIR